MSKNRLVAALAATVFASGVLIVATTGPASAKNDFVLTAHETNFQYNNLPPNSFPKAGPGIGDHFYIRDDLRQNGKLVGFDNVDCLVLYNDNLLCNGVFALTGKGDLTGTTLIRGGASANSPSVFDIAITGGTFAYRSARGDIHAVQTSETDSRYEIHLTS